MKFYPDQIVEVSDQKTKNLYKILKNNKYFLKLALIFSPKIWWQFIRAKAHIEKRFEIILSLNKSYKCLSLDSIHADNFYENNAISLITFADLVKTTIKKYPYMKPILWKLWIKLDLLEDILIHQQLLLLIWESNRIVNKRIFSFGTKSSWDEDIEQIDCYHRWLFLNDIFAPHWIKVK